MLLQSPGLLGGEHGGLLPFLTKCLGSRTELAGLTAMTWPTTSQSKSIRMAAKCSLTEGAARRAWRNSI
jgi:hypothetical protein